MWLANRLLGSFLLLSFCSIGFSQPDSWSPVLRGKVEKALNNLYSSEQVSFEPVIIDDNIDTEVSNRLQKHLFKAFSDKTFKGYVYVAQAPSLKNVFDYLVIFNTDLSIDKAKVLIYREQHGRQIGSTRWLSQFKGMTPSDQPELGKNIDGISGATISARSMTVSIKDLLASLAIIKKKGIL